MPGATSSTGLLPARKRLIFRVKQKDVELLGLAKPAPLALRPFAGLFNPYPYGCSVLCNHPADCEAKEVVRRAKDNWASEGRAILLPEEMEMIRAGLLAATGSPKLLQVPANIAVPEELFRKYTETDSRPLTPAPTLASGPGQTLRPSPDDTLRISKPREKTTLILDLRAEPQDQENETLTWHALTLEPPPPQPPRMMQISPCRRKCGKKIATRQEVSTKLQQVVTDESQDLLSNCEHESESEEQTITRRRGRRLRKRKFRRGSAYGQQTEIRDPLETAITQVSRVDDTSRRSSSQRSMTEKLEEEITSEETTNDFMFGKILQSSFIPKEILKHLCRELDRERVEEEFSLRKRLALEEALRVKGLENSPLANNFSEDQLRSLEMDIPRLFSRKTARFELLGAQSLNGLTPLGYLSRHVFVTCGRKMRYRKAFNKLYNERRLIPPDRIFLGLRIILGKSLTEEQKIRLNYLLGELEDPLDFRSWCGLCAAAERLLAKLPAKENDPPTSLEKADFEALEKRLDSINVSPRLATLLKEIRDR